jgi:hypothetical protein
VEKVTPGRSVAQRRKIVSEDKKKPVIQNIPMRTVEGRELRQVLTADRVFCEADFSALEMRIASQIADEIIVEAEEPTPEQREARMIPDMKVTMPVFATAVCQRGEHGECLSYICGCPCHD